MLDQASAWQSGRKFPTGIFCRRTPNRLTCINLHHTGFTSFSSSTRLPPAPNQVGIYAPRLHLPHCATTHRHAWNPKKVGCGTARITTLPSRRLWSRCAAPPTWFLRTDPPRPLPRVLTSPPQVDRIAKLSTDYYSHPFTKRALD